MKSPSGATELTLLPKKFHKLIWIKRGEYVIVLKEQDSKTETEGCKVKSVIQHVLSREQIKHLQKENLWPMEFENSSDTKRSSYSMEDILPDMEDEDEEGDEDLEEEETEGLEGGHGDEEN